MPKIPVIQASQNLPEVGPGVRVPVESAGREWSALADLGKVMTHEGVQYQEALTTAQNRVDRVRVLSEVEKDSMSFHDSLRDRTDWEWFVPEYQKMAEGNLEKYRSMVKSDAQWGLLEPRIRERILHYGNAISKASYDVRHRLMGLDAQVSADTQRDSYVKTGNPEIVEEWAANVLSIARTGAIGRSEAQSLIAKVGRDGDMLRASQVIDASPEEAHKVFSNADLTRAQFPYLGEDHRVKLVKEAENAAWVKYGRLQRQEQELREDTKILFFDLMDKVEAGKMPVKDFMSRLDAAVQRDPVTGVRAMSGETRQHFRTAVERLVTGTEPEVNMGVYGALSADSLKVRDGEMSYTDQVNRIIKSGLPVKEQKRLIDQARIDAIAMGRAATREGKESDRVAAKQINQEITSIKKNVIEKGWGTNLKSAAKERLGRALYEFDQFAQTITDPKDIPRLKEYADSLVKWNRSGGVVNTLKSLFGTEDQGAKTAPGNQTPQVIQVPMGWKPTGEYYKGKPVYLDQNGIKKVWQ